MFKRSNLENFPFYLFLSGTLRNPRRLIRMKHLYEIKRVSRFVNTGDTHGGNTNVSIWSVVYPSVFY